MAEETSEIERLRSALKLISGFSVIPGPKQRPIPTPEAKIAMEALKATS